MVDTILVAVVLLANGLAAGVLTGTVLGGVPLLQALPTDRYVHAHAFFAGLYDPFMPLCLASTALGDGVLALRATDGTARALLVVAAIAAAAVITVSVTRNVPINRWVKTLDPDALPADFDDPRPRWAHWNRIRTALAVLALTANVSAVAVLL